MPRWWTALRDVLLFAGGLAGVAHETLVHTGPERLGLLALFASMLGLPYALAISRRDAAKQAAPEPPGPAGGTGLPSHRPDGAGPPAAPGS